MNRNVIFFDVGGTLLRPSEPVGVSYVRFAKPYGHELDPARLTKNFRRVWKEMMDRDPEKGPRVLDDKNWWRELVQRVWAEEAPWEAEAFDDYFEKVYDYYRLPEAWHVFEDVLPVLKDLQARGIRLAVLSNWDKRLRPLLSTLGLTPYFEQLFISSELGVEKPHPRIFEQAAAGMEITPDQAVLIGDDPDHDQVGGEQAGWRVYLVDRPRMNLIKILEGVL